ncbi:hypothetical protein Bca52824_033697 [Brassica carinata]|uniref:Uncharacterized protein n=1 Tax=Brassica carinata TaxID=52824 RepID=A0A8X7V9K4_BRACI|nr:hypothetical protein Bca52824_033697 [Brassica carinata]
MKPNNPGYPEVKASRRDRKGRYDVGVRSRPSITGEEGKDARDKASQPPKSKCVAGTITGRMTPKPGGVEVPDAQLPGVSALASDVPADEKSNVNHQPNSDLFRARVGPRRHARHKFTWIPLTTTKFLIK